MLNRQNTPMFTSAENNPYLEELLKNSTQIRLFGILLK